MTNALFQHFVSFCFLSLLSQSLLSFFATLKFQSQVADSIGFLLGVVFVMSNQMLILFAIFADRAHKVGLSDGIAVQQSQRAMAVFSFFLFLVYGFFGLVLAIFRNDVVKEGERDLSPLCACPY